MNRPNRSASSATLPPPPGAEPKVKRVVEDRNSSSDSEDKQSSASSNSNSRGEVERKHHRSNKGGNAGGDDGDDAFGERLEGDNITGHEEGDAGFEQLFMEYATNEGFINGADLCDILNEMGMQCDQDSVKDLVTGSWEQIDIDSAKDVMTAMRMKQTDQVITKAVEDNTTEVVVMGVGEYICMVLSCNKKANIEYHVKMPTCNLLPRHILVGSTGVMMLLVSGFIILTVALMWLAYSRSNEESQFKEFGTSVEIYISGMEQLLLKAMGQEQADMSGTLARFIDQTNVLKMQRRVNNARLETAAAASALNRMTEARQLKFFQEVGRYMLTQVTILSMHADLSPIVLRQFFDNMTRSLSSRYKSTPSNPSPWEVLMVDENSTLILDVNGYCNTSSNASTSSSSLSKVPCRTDIPCFDPSEYATGAIHQFPRTVGPRSTGVVASGAIYHLPGLLKRHIVCMFQSQADMNSRAQDHAATMPLMNYDEQYYFQPAPSKRRTKYLRPKYLAVMPMTATADNPQVRWPVINRSIPMDPCYTAGSCGKEMNSLIYQAIQSRKTQSAVNVLGPDNKLQSVIAAATNYNFALIMTMDKDQFITALYQDMILIFEHINYQRIIISGAAVETVLFLKNETDGEPYQASPYAFEQDCYEDCTRSPEAKENAAAGFAHKGESGFSITPDYRPEAVLGGYGSFGDLEFVVLVERDVISIRGEIVNLLVAAIGVNNDIFDQSFGLMLVHPLGALTTKTFDPDEPCPPRVLCYTVENKGVVYRGDCKHCTRQAKLTTHKVDYLTQPKGLALCEKKGINCTAEFLQTKENDIAYESLFSTERSGFVDGLDYSDTRVLGAFGRSENFTLMYFVKQHYDDIYSPILNQIFISLGASLGMVLVALIVLVSLSRSLIVKIEADWEHSKEQIKVERKSFADTVREVFPMHIAEKVMEKTYMHVESRNVSVAFLDMSGLNLRLKDWPASSVCRYITYVQHVLERFVQYFSLYRLRCIGETTIIIGGLEDDMLDAVSTTATTGATAAAAAGAGEDAARIPHTVRMLQFLGALYQSCTRRYAHFPHRAELMEETFGKGFFSWPDVKGFSQYTGTIIMPAFKTGVHFGHATLCVIHLEGKPPHYDLLGQTAALTQRMVSTCKTGNVRVTENVKEQVEKGKAFRDQFEFTIGQTTLIRGRGTVTAHYVRRATVPVPLPVLQDMGVRFAKHEAVFGEEARLLRDQSIVSSITTSSTSSGTKSNRSGAKD